MSQLRMELISSLSETVFVSIIMVIYVISDTTIHCIYTYI
jgi:hypothetical protein